jgi:hypothetical protein
MPKSKTHQKRKLKKRKRQDKFNSLIEKRLTAFKALPEEDQVALLTKWKQKFQKQEEPVGQLGGVTTPVEEEEDATSR